MWERKGPITLAPKDPAWSPNASELGSSGFKTTLVFRPTMALLPLCEQASSPEVP